VRSRARVLRPHVSAGGGRYEASAYSTNIRWAIAFYRYSRNDNGSMLMSTACAYRSLIAINMEPFYKQINHNQQCSLETGLSGLSAFMWMKLKKERINQRFF
jgi:hypothetical protein